ncbi:MAG: hypothetical protein WBM28_04335 [Burkholderiales bacterium]
MSDSDDLVRKTDAFLSRYRPSAAPAQDDFPVLTEVVGNTAAARPVEAPAAGTLTETELQEIKQKLRQQLLDAIGPYVTNFLDESLRVRLESHLQRTLASFTDQVRADVEALVQESIVKAVEHAVTRLRERSRGGRS